MDSLGLRACSKRANFTSRLGLASWKVMGELVNETQGVREMLRGLQAQLDFERTRSPRITHAQPLYQGFKCIGCRKNASPQLQMDRSHESSIVTIYAGWYLWQQVSDCTPWSELGNSQPQTMNDIQEEQSPSSRGARTFAGTGVSRVHSRACQA